MGIVDFDLLSWQNFLDWEVLSVMGFAVIAIFIIALRPRMFWPWLVASAIMGNLLRMKGYILADEILLGGVVIGGLMVVAVMKVRGQGLARLELHTLVFLLWMGYLTIQTARGVAVTGDTRVVRWAYLYGNLALGVYLMSKSNFQVRSIRSILIVAVLSTLVVFGVYLAQGLYFQRALGPYGRFLSQDQYVAGPAYAVFPIVIALPSAILLLRDPSRKVRLLAWATFPVTMAVAYYFDTRIAWLVMAVIVAVSVPRIGMAKIILLALVFVGLSLAPLPQARYNLPQMVANLWATANNLWSPTKTDTGRILDLRAGLKTASETPGTTLFGYGVNSHKFVVVPEYLYLRSRYMPERDFVIPGTPDLAGARVIRTTGFTALLLDTGWIGVILWLATIALAAQKVVTSKSSDKPLLLAILFVSMMWPLSNNVWDIVLLYLLLMPRGLVELLSRYQAVPATSAVARAPVLRGRPLLTGGQSHG